MESLLRRHHVASRKLVTDQVSDTRWSLNLDHEIWCNPWKKQMASTQSFPDLFYQCLTKCRTVYYLFNQLITSGAVSYTHLMYGTGSYHWNRKYRGSGNSFESRWSGSCFLDVDLGAFGNDDRICGGVAGNPLPLPE